MYEEYQEIPRIFERGKVILERSSFVEISAKKRIFSIVGKCHFGHLTRKNAFFGREMTSSTNMLDWGQNSLKTPCTCSDH